AVRAVDSSNQILTGYVGRVHFTSSDAAAILPPDYSFTTGPGGDNGVHTFTGVVLNTAGGSQTITAADSNFSISNFTSILVNPSVTPNRPSTTTLTPPSTAVFGQPASFAVTASSISGGTPTGTVTLFDNGSSVGSGLLNGSGQTTIVTSSLSLGTHSNITAFYNGDVNYVASTSVPVS